MKFFHVRPDFYHSDFDHLDGTYATLLLEAMIIEIFSSFKSEGHRAEPLTGLLRRAPKGRPTRIPPPVVPDPESIAAQVTVVLLFLLHRHP